MPGLSLQRAVTTSRFPAWSACGRTSGSFVVHVDEVATALEADPQDARRASPSESSIMRYLGRIAGAGLLTCDGEAIARAFYEFEGFMRPKGVVTSSGEISLPPVDLKTVFGRRDVQLLTDDGHLLNLKFSQKAIRSADDVALVEVTGDLPSFPANGRG